MHTPQLLGGEFLLRYARVAPPGKKCAFVLTRDGRPVKVQRTIFSECFYTMAMNELWKVTGEMHYQVCGSLWGPQAVGHECTLTTSLGTCQKTFTLFLPFCDHVSSAPSLFLDIDIA